jgi:L-2-hydroxyglutarate oxidase LhgO
MQSLEQDISESESGTLVYSTAVVRVDPYRRPTTQSFNDPVQEGWVVQIITGGSGTNQANSKTDSILTRTLINASGLSATQILNSLLPERQQIPMFSAPGSYAAYSGPGISRVSRLIYPSPEPNEKKNLFHSLGTHLTLDLEGRVRFGPDLEWVSPSQTNDAQNPDFWHEHLVPDGSRLEQMHRAVTDYLSGVTLQGMRPDFVGIRPKIVGPGAGFHDFVIRVDSPSDFGGDSSPGGHRRGPMITTLGIESPGLTSSLAIAEYITEDILAKME